MNLEKTRSIFGNIIDSKTVKKAKKTCKKYLKRFGDDRNTKYHLALEENKVLSELGTKNLVISENPLTELPKNPIIIGNIRMGFGHYRISMAFASAAKALGYSPVWMDLNSFKNTTCTKIISSQNDLYSLGSRLSQKSKLFNKLYWEPLNSEGFRKLTYNAVDQAASSLMTPVFTDIPKDIPFIATHAWPSQAAVHAGMKNVLNAIPDNWPMALHLSEGALHAIQTHSSYLGYKVLRGMAGKKILNPMTDKDIIYTGHYIDHELVSNIEEDCKNRVQRVKDGKPMRFLLTVGGAGAQGDFFIAIIKSLLPYIKENKASLFVNVGDHKNVWEDFEKKIPELKEFSKSGLCKTHFEDFEEVKDFANKLTSNEKADNRNGIHIFYDSDIFSAVYSTNLLMRISDVLITKPSELAFYPIPKLHIKRVGGHEMWGAIHSAEVGDGTYECETVESTVGMIHEFLSNPSLLEKMCNNIIEAKKAGIYNGAYEAIKALAKRGEK